VDGVEGNLRVVCADLDRQVAVAAALLESIGTKGGSRSQRRGMLR
jgi:hypothetical protein